jgi:hypothetical protein
MAFPTSSVEHRRKNAFRIQIRRWSDADRSGARGTKVRKNVSQQIRADHHIKPVRMLYEVGCQNVDMKLVCLNQGIFEPSRCFSGASAMIPCGTSAGVPASAAVDAWRR